MLQSSYPAGSASTSSYRHSGSSGAVAAATGAAWIAPRNEPAPSTRANRSGRKRRKYTAISPELVQPPYLTKKPFQIWQQLLNAEKEGGADHEAERAGDR